MKSVLAGLIRVPGMTANENSGNDSTAAAHRFVLPSQPVKNTAGQLFDFLSLIKSWPEIVGENLAKQTIPLKNIRNTLTILTRHSVFSQQLGLLESVLLDKIHQAFPASLGNIKKLKFITDTTYFDKKNVQQINIEGEKSLPHPQSPEFKMQNKAAQNLFSDVLDPDVRQNLISIYMQMRN